MCRCTEYGKSLTNWHRQSPCDSADVHTKNFVQQLKAPPPPEPPPHHYDPCHDPITRCLQASALENAGTIPSLSASWRCLKREFYRSSFYSLVRSTSPLTSKESSKTHTRLSLRFTSQSALGAVRYRTVYQTRTLALPIAIAIWSKARVYVDCALSSFLRCSRTISQYCLCALTQSGYRMNGFPSSTIHVSC